MPLPRFIPQYSVADYQSWEGHWELWSGVPVAMSPSSDRRHQYLGGLLVAALVQEIRSENCSHCQVLYETDWIADQSTVFRPDIQVACDAHDSKFVESPPALAVEILSTSTRSKDLLYKREAYESLGVRYYLVVDPEERTTLLLENREGRYHEYRSNILELHQGCRIELDLAALFGGLNLGSE